MPIPVLTVEQGGVVYRQRTFVAPSASTAPSADALDQPSVCVAEFVISNGLSQPAEAVLGLAFRGPPHTSGPPRLEPSAQGFVVLQDQAPVAVLDLAERGPLESQPTAGGLALAGRLAAHTTARCVLFLPGQGILTILIGVSLLDIPFRHKVLNTLIHRPALQHALNWIRQKTGHPPFNFPSPPL